MLLLFTVFVALMSHLTKGDPYAVYSNALKSGLTFLAFLFTGPGRYSLDGYLFGTRGRG